MKTLPHLLRLCLLGTALLALSAEAQAPADIRIALVIGNSAYQGGAALANPAHDAKAMSETLRGMGFVVVELRDGSKAQMNAAVAKVQAALKGKQGVGMLYYAGHGLQVDARNYMVPVDAKVLKVADVPQQTVDVNNVVEAFKAAGNRMNILVLDACRNNPFGSINTGKGLAPLDAPSGTFLAYATAPGNVAEDGDVKTGNGLYTQYLLQELKKPHARIEDVFKRVRFAVRKASDGRQIPWESTSLEDDFEFNDGKIIAPVKLTARQLQAEFSVEKQDWDRIKNSGNVDDFYAFIQKYPSGTITEAAHDKLNLLTKPRLVVQGAGADGKDQAYSVSKFRLGDVYEKRVTTSSANINTAMKLIYRVIKVEPDRIEVMLEYPDSKGAVPNTKMVFDGSAGLLAMGEISRYDPPQQYVPGGLLQVGRSWASAYTVTFGSSLNFPPRTQAGEARIVAREQLNLPAGVFNTFRMEVTARAFDAKGEQPASQSTVWMVPDLPLPVRSESTLDTPGIGKMKVVEEMVRIVRGS